jgi:hypothetical protein
MLQSLWLGTSLLTLPQKDSSQVAPAAPPACMSIQETLLSFCNVTSTLCFNNSQTATECVDQQGNPCLELQRARISWLSNQDPLEHWPPVHGAYHWTNHQDILLYLVVTSNICQKKWVNFLRTTNKGYFTPLCTGSCLDLYHKQTPHCHEFQGSQAMGQVGSYK